ncbi:MULTISPECIES: GTP cyclohydrolase III [Haloferax]|uniref:GTP cyclohydrolase III n=1 Tax=Haloferax marinum TaxID=2666143 RepID=A0A6A8G4J1_9EURY|nr:MULTISPECIES: GTP cyclohydrolase III [Haloferax]KAB1196491.1 GTP cyclohydrolase IIa [Haloferax sp. CBA1150]MRW95488.1 GTP cyclohydrolase IIa [Haloferax marinum]
MTNTQLTLVQIDNYGPWTVTPDPRREMDLQTLQSRLFADLAQFVGSRDGYVFFTRFDNMVAVTNGLDRADHELLQESIGNRYPVTLSLGIGADRNPAVALERATDGIQRAGSAQDGDRREVLSGEPIADADRSATDLQIAHFDVNDATGKYTDRLNEFDTFIHIEQGYASLMRYLRREHGALSFFVGGDNIIAVTPDLSEDQYNAAIDHVEAEADVELKVGVGTASNAHEAGFAAKHALEDCRDFGTTVEFADASIETAHD